MSVENKAKVVSLAHRVGAVLLTVVTAVLVLSAPWLVQRARGSPLVAIALAVVLAIVVGVACFIVMQMRRGG